MEHFPLKQQNKYGCQYCKLRLMRLFVLENDASNGHDFTVLFGNFDVNKLMHQSIPAAPMPPTPSPRVSPGHSQFFVLYSKFPRVGAKCQQWGSLIEQSISAT